MYTYNLLNPKPLSLYFHFCIILMTSQPNYVVCIFSNHFLQIYQSFQYFVLLNHLSWREYETSECSILNRCHTSRLSSDLCGRVSVKILRARGGEWLQEKRVPDTIGRCTCELREILRICTKSHHWERHLGIKELLRSCWWNSC